MMQAHFSNCSEIRMGSPFQTCHLALEGEWIPPDLPEDDWVKVQGRSEDGRWVALARWAVAGNVPGFVIYLIDCRERKVTRSERFAGCCNRLIFEDELLTWHTYPDGDGFLVLPTER